VLREFLTSRRLRCEHRQGGAQRSEQNLYERNNAVSSAAQFTKPENFSQVQISCWFDVKNEKRQPVLPRQNPA
jgi:hypothetical protein